VFCLAFRRNPWILIERKTSGAILRKIRGPREPLATRKAKQRKNSSR